MIYHLLVGYFRFYRCVVLGCDLQFRPKATFPCVSTQKIVPLLPKRETFQLWIDHICKVAFRISLTNVYSLLPMSIEHRIYIVGTPYIPALLFVILGLILFFTTKKTSLRLHGPWTIQQRTAVSPPPSAAHDCPEINLKNLGREQDWLVVISHAKKMRKSTNQAFVHIGAVLKPTTRNAYILYTNNGLLLL